MTESHHILVVDDDVAIRKGLCKVLELEGYTVVDVEHGQAALDHLKTSARPCLILLDLMMPIMDGRTFRQKMLKDPQLAPIPVVLITAGGPQLSAGVPAAGVLQKPLRLGTVVGVVKQHCQTPKGERTGG
jgi:CheY-like chemotaxis protein